jgi:hypothetical protein
MGQQGCYSLNLLSGVITVTLDEYITHMCDALLRGHEHNADTWLRLACSRIRMDNKRREGNSEQG